MINPIKRDYYQKQPCKSGKNWVFSFVKNSLTSIPGILLIAQGIDWDSLVLILIGAALVMIHIDIYFLKKKVEKNGVWY